MTDEIKVQDAGTATRRSFTVAILVVIGGVAGYYVLAGWPAWLRWTAVAASLALAALVLAFSYYGASFASSWSWRASSCARSCGRAARRRA